MFGRLTGISRRVETLAAKVGAATADGCGQCRAERVSFFMQSATGFHDGAGRAIDAVRAARPDQCACGHPFAYQDILFAWADAPAA
jgi:hypothetical protein